MAPEPVTTPVAAMPHMPRLAGWRAAAGIAWAAPCSALGLVGGLALLLAGGSVQRVGRTLEFAFAERAGAGAFVRRLPFAAITIGHVVLGTSRRELARLRAHEQVHVRQYERWGPIFLLAYPLASLVAWARGGCPYRDNRFEAEACGAPPAA